MQLPRRNMGAIQMASKINSNLHKFMAVPAVILFAIFFVYPLCRGVGISLTNYNGISAPKFVGLKNFIEFFHDERALKDILNTLQFGLVSAALLNIFGLMYALIFDMNTTIKRVCRTIVYIPAVISGLIMGYIWLMILSPETGMLYKILLSINAQGLFKDLLGSMDNAMWLIIGVNVWQWVGGPMIIYLAGLQSIPVELYEASKMDGASYLTNLWHITLPLLIPSIKINVITNIIGSLAVFDIIAALTDGGPGYATESLSMFIYRNTYGGSTGYATAVAVIMFFIVLIPVVLSLTVMRSKEVEM
jgi:raffinose/stachyose/melibiose transport system permease protein